jgi:anti-sigma regulatory factor (Ser/Thr protein kinase)
MPENLTLEFSTRASEFDRFHRAAGLVADRAGLEEQDRYRFLVCVSEAFTNAYVHGNECDPHKKIHVRFCWDETNLQIEIEDQGSGEADKVDLQSASLDRPALDARGRGIGLMKKFADKIDIEERAGGGLRVTVFWQLPNRKRRLHAAANLQH